ncbi:glycoside hydrolase family 13 protein [Oscillibacter sp. MSJ-2]|uniref:Glycoside hydrolase family 13 protein n=1 Tax=Dysosmobacter acutus TaxID=2841504 RepID=A0ABS6F6V1_9FIRM|nr:glycoside hydrolase family 13 protein [Dysosmobacter acutus]MBU5625783.1 glycoside hydrolase family 13 protein [Dysosmobacter acutus]
MSSCFDSRDPRCKTPYGAVPTSTPVTLTLRPVGAEGFPRCELLAYHDFAASEEVLALSPTEEGGFTITFSAPAEPEIVWYAFRFYRADGSSRCLTRGGWGESADERRWQLTVYSGHRSTPEWFGRGITYQIFPDRFCRLSLPKPDGVVGNRVVHKDWNEPMDYLPDPDGEVRSRDFYGGSLLGISSKLPYLQSLGVSTLYLCPIFESASNHRYNTADYRKIDPFLGTEEDFAHLCGEGRKYGIRVVLDGVFNHTGSNSVYFNQEGFYPSVGAAQSLSSPYAGWYRFSHWPDQYDAWWGIRTLPAVQEDDPGYRAYMVTGEDSVIRRWLRLGASGWRLDVADELPDDFIRDIRRAMEETEGDAILLGEVWEDGSNKIAYSQRRRYLLGDETHALMNYPFRNAALAYLLGGPAEAFYEAMESIRENYPAPAFYSAMNFLGTHDTPRILTLLGQPAPITDRAERRVYRLSGEELRRGLRRLRLAALLLYAFPGSPTIFYGDEAGMQGFEDPFNRGTFPWGHENRELLEHYRLLGRIRTQRPSLQSGTIRYQAAQGGLLVFSRQEGDETTWALFNCGAEERSLTLPYPGDLATDLLTGQQFAVLDGEVELTLPSLDGMLLV